MIAKPKPQSWYTRQGLSETEAAKRMMQTAQGFAIAALRAREQRPTGPHQFEMPVVPVVVCAAFQIELVLKALHILDFRQEVDEWRHRIDVMFFKLRDTSKNDVRQRFHELAKDRDLNVVLQRSSQAFKQWRYVFENDGGVHADPDGLLMAAQAMQETLEARLGRP